MRIGRLSIDKCRRARKESRAALGRLKRRRNSLPILLLSAVILISALAYSWTTIGSPDGTRPTPQPIEISSTADVHIYSVSIDVQIDHKSGSSHPWKRPTSQFWMSVELNCPKQGPIKVAIRPHFNISNVQSFAGAENTHLYETEGTGDLIEIEPTCEQAGRESVGLIMETSTANATSHISRDTWGFNYTIIALKNWAVQAENTELLLRAYLPNDAYLDRAEPPSDSEGIGYLTWTGNTSALTGSAYYTKPRSGANTEWMSNLWLLVLSAAAGVLADVLWRTREEHRVRRDPRVTRKRPARKASRILVRRPPGQQRKSSPRR